MAEKKVAKKKAPARKTPAKKKAVAKKSPVKKAAAKKAVAKKAPVKKVAVKKAAVKKAAAKKAPAKKVAVKKAPIKKAPVKKVAAKKAAVKRAPVKKSPVKKQSSTITAIEKITPALEIEKPSNVLLDERPPVSTVSLPTAEKGFPASVEKKEEKRRRTGLFILLPVVVIAGFLFVSSTDSEEVIEAPKTEVTEEPKVVLGAPQNVYADYTPTGGKVTWEVPTTNDQVVNFLVQYSYRGSEFKTIATVEKTTLSFEVMKVDTPGFTAFRIVAVYPDAEMASDISEIKGKYEAQP